MKFSLQDLFLISDKALTLSERLRIYASIYESKEIHENSFQNAALIEKWCQVVAQGDWRKFEKRLAWDDIDLKKLNDALHFCFIINEQYLPSWITTLNEYMEEISTFCMDKLEGDISKIDRCLFSWQTLAFEEILWPLVSITRKKIKAQTDSSYKLLSKKAHINLERCLLRSLSNLCAPSMQLEFSIFRTTRQSTVVNVLKTSNNNYAKLQYKNFIKNLLEGGLLCFFREYSVLAHLLIQLTDLWLETTKELLLRLQSDWVEIQKTFNQGIKLGQVISVQPFLSDRHHSGRSVTLIKFSSGLKLIYKPKEIGIEEAYFNLLCWLNEQNLPLKFKLLKVLNHSTYRWIEFVENTSYKDKEEARRYYQRFGMLICLAQVLGATDLHFQNIIPCGEHPVLIDVESLMHPQIREKIYTEFPNKNILDIANGKLENSVLRTGLLPRWQFNAENQSFDFSPLGEFSQHKTILKVPIWFNVNTDNMRVIYEHTEVQQLANTPSQNRVILSSMNYSEDIVAGFEQMYRFLIEKRQAILAPESPLTVLNSQLIRFIFRPTAIYRLILETALEPFFLRDGTEWSIQLDLLSSIMLSSDIKPQSWLLIKLEKQALEQLDMPLFTAHSNSNALKITRNQIIEEYFIEPSFSRVIANINQINNEDLEYQISIIRGLLYSHKTGEIHSRSLPNNLSFILNNVLPLTQEEMVHQAVMVATGIDKQAIRSADGSATWLTPQYLLEAQRFQIQPMGNSLFDGSFGVASFLAALTQFTLQTRFYDLSLGALQSFRQDLKTAISANFLKEIGIGGAMGSGAIVYVLTRVSQFLQESTLLEDATQVAYLITSELIYADKKLDIIFGTAGTILGLLALHTTSLDSEVLKKAITCGNHLLNNRVTSESGYKAWATVEGKLLTGFSHGAAGIAYALLRLYKASEETAFLEAATEAIAYERSVFIPELNNWPDFRQPQTKDNPKCMCSWCHGAPGIGLARVATLDILDTPEIRQDIEAAITTTLNYGLSDIDHLCCGNMGRVEFLFTAGRKLNRPELVETAMKLASQVVARTEQQGHYGYGPILDFHPGFFQGASGIGYQLLRLAYPDQLPSVLLWE